MMFFDTYQGAVQGTMASYRTPKEARAVFGLGVAGESWEVADLIKKEVGHGHPADPVKMKKELGDVLWYVAALCTQYGFAMADVAAANIRKIQERYPNGFSPEASLKRVDVSQ